MVTLTCKHHPELRWHTKAISWDDSYGYLGIRNIFFQDIVGEGEEARFIKECSCPASDLVRIEEPADHQAWRDNH